MKEKENEFLMPKAEIVLFNTSDDIITTSVGDSQIPWYEDGQD